MGLLYLSKYYFITRKDATVSCGDWLPK